MDYMRKEWRTDNRPVPMSEEKLNALIKEQALTMRAIHDNKK
jgi:hypothetical protein